MFKNVKLGVPLLQPVEILFKYGKQQSKGMKDILTDLKENLSNNAISKWNINSICEKFAWSKMDGKENGTQFCKCPICDYADYPEFCSESILNQTACNTNSDCR